MAKLGF